MEAPQSSPPLPMYLQPIDESKLIPQCRDLLPSLPMEPCWLNGSIHQYQGYWFTTRTLESVLLCQNHFEARDSDIFLITMPKSGTTWLKAILFVLVNRTRYPPTSADHPLLSKNPHDLIPFMELLTLSHPEKKISDYSLSTPHRIFTAHTPYVLLSQSVKELSCKVVYLCRNPKDVFISSWMFFNKMRGNWRAPLTLDEAFNKFCRGSMLGGPYWENVLGHWKESLANPHKVMFLKYEDVKQSPGVVVRGLATFLGFPFSPDEESKGIVDEIIKLCSFEKLASLEANGPNKKTTALGSSASLFFRKGEVGDWANYLTAEMAAQIDSITKEKFKGSGLTF